MSAHPAYSSAGSGDSVPPFPKSSTLLLGVFKYSSQYSIHLTYGILRVHSYLLRLDI